MKKLFRTLLLTLILTLSFGMCASAAVKKISITKPTKKSSTTVSLTAKNPTKTLNLKWTLKTSGKTNNTVKVKSSNSKVVSVAQTSNTTAQLTVKKAGAATITVYNGKVKDTLKITVKQSVTSITPKEAYVFVQKGKSVTLKYTVLPKLASNKKVTFKSSKSSVASVNSKGKITGKKAGTATITIKAKDGSGISAKVYVTVGTKTTKVTKVTASAGTTTLNPGQTTTISASVTPAKATNKKVRYESSNTAVATVSSKGVVTAKAAGTTVIKVIANDGSKKYASITINVVRPVYTKVLSADASKLGGSYKMTTNVAWSDYATVKKAADELVCFTNTSLTLTCNNTAYKVICNANGMHVEDASGTDRTKEFYAGTLTSGTVNRSITADRFSSMLVKAEIRLGQITVQKSLGNAVVTAGGSKFEIRNVALNGKTLCFTLDGSSVTAVLGSGKITVKTEGSIDKAANAVIALLGDTMKVS